MNLPKPPAGAQVDRKKPLNVLHSYSTYRIVESIGNYPVLMDASSNVISDNGYLTTEANARNMKAQLEAFTRQPSSGKFKRWGEVLRAYADANGGNAAFEKLVPYPCLRDILFGLTAEKKPTSAAADLEKPAGPAPTPKKTIAPVKTPTPAPEKTPTPAPAPEKTPIPAPAPTSEPVPATGKTPVAVCAPAKKREAAPSAKAPSKKRVKIDEFSSEEQLRNVSNEQLLYILGEYQVQPEVCDSKYKMLLDSSLRTYYAVKNYLLPSST